MNVNVKRIALRASIFVVLSALLYYLYPTASSSKGCNEEDCKCRNGHENLTCLKEKPYLNTLIDENQTEITTIMLPDGGKYTGQLINGKPDGQGTLISLYGSTYTGNFSDGKPHGMGTRTCPDGSKYVGQFKNGYPNGMGTMTSSYGSTYTGEFMDGEPDGKGTTTYIDGGKYVGQWKHGEKHGLGAEVYREKNGKSGYWKYGKYIGITNPEVKTR